MNDFKKLAVLENEVEAGLLESVLKERGIPHLFVSYHDMAFDGLFQAQKGWGHVSAPASFEKDVLEIITDLRKNTD